MVVAIPLQLSMTVFVLRSGEIPRRVSPGTMASPTKRVEMFCEPFLVAFSCGDSLWFVAQRRMMALFCGSSAFALIDFNLLIVDVAFAFLHPCVDVVESSSKLFAQFAQLLSKMVLWFV